MLCDRRRRPSGTSSEGARWPANARRGRCRGKVVAMGIGLASLLRTFQAWAMPGVLVHADGGCPNAAQVSAALDYVLKGSDGTPTRASGTQALVLAVSDLGPRFRVSLGDEVRVYEDSKRDCEERARVAGVFAAITMEPPEVTARAKPPAPLAPPPPAFIKLCLAVVSDLGLQQSSQTLAWGGELRGIVSGRHWGLELGIGGQAPADMAWGTYHATITRFPMDLSFRGSLRWAWIVPSVSVGVALAGFHLRGEGSGVPVPEGGTRLDVGARAAISLEVPTRGRVSPFVTLHGTVWPRPYAVVVDPAGQVGTTPQLWVGASIGAALAVP